MHPLLNIFQKAFYINLDKRIDRRQNMEEQLKKIGLEAERFPAISPTECGQFPSIGHRGCVLSHQAIIQKAYNEKLNEKLDNILIMEDDCQFDLEFNNELVNELTQITRWDLVFFYYYKCCGHYKVKPIGKYFQYIEGTGKTHFYGVHSTSFKKVLDLINNGNDSIDQIYAQNSTELDVISTIKNFVVQKNDYSDIAEEQVIHV
jgi:hypothetical protein